VPSSLGCRVNNKLFVSDSIWWNDIIELKAPRIDDDDDDDGDDDVSPLEVAVADGTRTVSRVPNLTKQFLYSIAVLAAPDGDGMCCFLRVHTGFVISVKSYDPDNSKGIRCPLKTDSPLPSIVPLSWFWRSGRATMISLQSVEGQSA